MIYGINFGAPPVRDAGITPRPKERVRVTLKDGALSGRGPMADLKGACQTDAEKRSMTIIAGNGRRHLYWVQQGGWHLLYIFY